MNSLGITQLSQLLIIINLLFRSNCCLVSILVLQVNLNCIGFVHNKQNMAPFFNATTNHLS